MLTNSKPDLTTRLSETSPFDPIEAEELAARDAGASVTSQNKFVLLSKNFAKAPVYELIKLLTANSDEHSFIDSPAPNANEIIFLPDHFIDNADV